MGYRIEYTPEDNIKYPTYRQNYSLQKWIISILLTAFILFMCLKPSARETLSEWLIPGDPIITKTALSNLLDELRSGNGMAEAITTFCKEIVINGRETQYT